MHPYNTVKTLDLKDSEAQQISALLGEIMAGREHVETLPLLTRAAALSGDLPRRVREFFYDFKRLEQHIGICVKGNPINPASIPPTPADYPPAGRVETAVRSEVLHYLYTALLGEPFAWSSIQNGYIMNEIYPIERYKNEGMSSGSAFTLQLHTDDAFSGLSGDYLGWICMRNPHRTPTVISGLPGLVMDEKTKRILFEPRFLIGVNAAHDRAQPTRKMSVLYGDFKTPYLRINLNKMSVGEEDTEARQALNCLAQVLQDNAFDFVPDAGACWYIQNFRAAHGRRPYTPTYAGDDRWIKRLIITSDLKKSIVERGSPASRLITAK